MITLGFDAGHGKDTYPPDKGVPEMAEYEFNSATVAYAQQLAVQQGFNVVLLQGLNHNDRALRERTERAFGLDVDAIISFHADANWRSSANGYWTFYWHDHAPSEKLADLWLSHADDILPLQNRGKRQSLPGTWTNFHMTREPATRRNIPAILVEHGFMTNEHDLQHLLSEDYRKKCAEVAVRACCDFFDVPFKEETAVPNIPEWKTDPVDYLAEEGKLNDPEGWKKKIDEPLPAWAVFIMLKRLYEDIEGVSGGAGNSFPTSDRNS